MGRLQQHLAAKTGEVYDSGNKNVAYRRQIFSDTNAGRELTLSQSDIADVVDDTKRGVDSYYKGFGMV